MLEEQSDEGYSRVRLDDGSEGWVLTQYLQSEQTAGQRLAVAESELASLRDTSRAQQERIATLEASLDEANAQIAAYEERLRALTAELADIRAASRDALATRTENADLIAQLADVRAQAVNAEIEIADLESRTRQNWFVLGAAVLFGGIVIGLVAPSLRPRRKTSW